MRLATCRNCELIEEFASYNLLKKNRRLNHQLMAEVAYKNGDKRLRRNAVAYSGSDWSIYYK